MPIKDARCRFLTQPFFIHVWKALPGLSKTEREALSAVDIWCDGNLFFGTPGWQKFLATPFASLPEKERASLHGLRHLYRLLPA